MWGYLRAAAVHYLTLEPDTFNEEVRKKAHHNLMKYAKSVEKVRVRRLHPKRAQHPKSQQLGMSAHTSQHVLITNSASSSKHLWPFVWQRFPADAGTSNLHRLLCRLPVQEAERGCVAYDTDFWVERGIQELKKAGHDRSVKHPEKVIVRYVTERTALDRWRREYGLNTIDELCPSLRNSLDDGPMQDTAPVGTTFVGTGSRANRSDWTMLVQAFFSNLVSQGDITQAAMEAAMAGAWHVHQRAHVRGAELVTSLAWRQARSRVNHNVSVNFAEGQEYIATVVAYLHIKVIIAGNTASPQYRLARIKAYQLANVRSNKQNVVRWQGDKRNGYYAVGKVNRYLEEEIVDVDCINFKVACAIDDDDKIYFLKYNKLSKMS